LVVLAISCARDEHFSGRDECSGVTCACTCPKRRNINMVIQDSCTLSSSVNKCIIICTPSIYGCINGSPCPPTYLVRDAGTVKDSKSRHNLLVRRQECVLLPSLLLFLSSILLQRILRYSYGISLYLELAREHSIQHSILGHLASSSYDRSRLPLFDTSPRTFYELPYNGIPSFFSHSTRAPYKDEYESDTPF